MNTSRILTLGFGSICIAFSIGAHAAGQMPGDSHITNGGTGYIGLTQSAGQPKAMNAYAGEAARMASLPAGEASTMVNGRPNVQPDAPGHMAAWSGDTTRAMGAMGAMHPRMQSGMNHPAMWGTPD